LKSIYDNDDERICQCILLKEGIANKADKSELKEMAVQLKDLFKTE
jgi:hypothetical protein